MLEDVGRVMCLDLTHRRVVLLCYNSNGYATQQRVNVAGRKM